MDYMANYIFLEAVICQLASDDVEMEFHLTQQ